jgi:hypothetical protein
MHLTRIDFASPLRTASKASVTLLVVGVLCSGAAVMNDAAQSETNLALQMQLKRAKNAFDRTQFEQKGGSGMTLGGFKQPDTLLQRLSIPWGGLLVALEQAQNESIALLGIEPDSGRSRLRLSGEAKDLSALVAYMKSIEGRGNISSVRLLSQQVKQDDAQHPIVFVIEARWVGLPGVAAKGEL